MINWDQVNQEVRNLLIDLIKINTANPPGNELEAAKYLQKVFEREGISSTIYEPAPGRGNLVARIQGKGNGRPLVLLGHLDVVAANPAQWTHPPFTAEIADGYIWGRGAIDMKGMLAMEALALILLKRRGQTPDREVILAAAADEEAGSEQGVEWLLKQDIPGLQDAEYIINEGGEGKIDNGIPVYACQNGEKGVLWVKMKVHGTPGHASMPSKDNAIARMAVLLNRIGRYKPTVTLSETTRKFLAETAKARGVRIGHNSANLDYSLQLFLNRHFKSDRSVQAMMHNTISPTIIRAGDKTNVLPEVCEATLDCRLVPGETPTGFLKKLKDIVNDSAVEWEVLQAAEPTESPVNTELFSIIQKTVQRFNPKAIAVPYLSPGGTDSRFFRRRGITAYGFFPVILPETELQRMHGIDERISLENLEQGTRILFETAKAVAGGDNRE
jgi:acetylornithine deacetylase/succinyl-diaminopimelate desuccinylase-like protein